MVSAVTEREGAVTANGIDSEVEIRPRGGRAFRCRVELLEPPRRMRERYPGDFIAGVGEWRLEAVACGTRVLYELDVVSFPKAQAIFQASWNWPYNRKDMEI